MKNNLYIGIDVGGSWLKGVAYLSGPTLRMAQAAEQIMQCDLQRVPSRLHVHSTVEDFIKSLDELLALFRLNPKSLAAIGLSTAGIVDYAGKHVRTAAPHLGALTSPVWKAYLEEKYKVPVILINDADATAIGAAARGYLHGSDTIGVMPVGTGIGFSLWRNGRRWQPGKTLPLIGSIRTPGGSFDTIGGVAGLARQTNHQVSRIFSEERFTADKELYISGLADIIYSACLLFRTTRILVGGGLAAAVTACAYPLGEELTARVGESLAVFGYEVKVDILPEGNRLPLIGAVLLALGEDAAAKKASRKAYAQIPTEMPYDPEIRLQEMEARSIVELLWQTEQEAGALLRKSVDRIADAARLVARKLAEGGRLIYVGAGTSGRLAALDTVELGCTFGFPREKVWTLIAGGVADAALEIESDFEEDASAVPEILLASVCENDVVIGISVSGSAYYVRSALAVARSLGAATLFIQEELSEDLPFADFALSLYSGQEVIAGSTRMKAGTATKKVLNFISTTAMILSGKVWGPYMIGVECINEKLVNRAQAILGRLFGMDEKTARALLSAHRNNLGQTLRQINDLK